MCKNIIVLTALTLVLYLNLANGLECYICNSVNETACTDNKNLEKFKKICPEDSDPKKTMCRRVIQTVEFQDDKGKAQTDKRVIRQCGWIDSHYTGRCYSRSGFGGRQEVCSCTTDFCNSTSNNKPYLSIVFAIGALGVLFGKFI